MLSKPALQGVAGRGARALSSLGRAGGLSGRAAASAPPAAPGGSLYAVALLGRVGGSPLAVASSPVRAMSLFGGRSGYAESRYARSPRAPSSSELARLEEAANGRPHDAGAQLPYLVGLQR